MKNTLRTWTIVSASRVAAITLWPVTVFAAGESLGATLGAVTAADWVTLAVLSATSGLVALLHRIRQSLEAAAADPASGPTQRIDWRVFALCHMTGAMFVGAMAFLFMEGFDVNTYIEAAFIALFSWGGAKIADKAADSLSDAAISRLGALLGQQQRKD